MSPFRFASASLVLALGGAFVGCSLFGSEETQSSATSTSSGQGGAGAAGGAGGSGGSAGASSSTGVGGSLPVDCTDHTNIPETSCSLLKQDCGNGETCRPNNLGTGTLCLPGAGVKSIGAPCAGESDNECATGL